MNSNVYIVVYPPTSKFSEAEAINPKYDSTQTEICTVCGRGLSGSEWIGEKSIKLNKKNIPDFLYLYGGSNLPFIVSEKAYSVLIDNDIKGIIKADKIDNIFFKGNKLNESFYQIYIARSLCAIDHKQSKIVYGKEYPEKKCRLCNPTGKTKDFIFGLYFDSNAKVVNDIFNIYEMGNTVFISERFIKVCKDNNLTGLFFEHINKYNSANGIFSEDEIIQMLKKN